MSNNNQDKKAKELEVSPVVAAITGAVVGAGVAIVSAAVINDEKKNHTIENGFNKAKKDSKEFVETKQKEAEVTKNKIEDKVEATKKDADMRVKIAKKDIKNAVDGKWGVIFKTVIKTAIPLILNYVEMQNTVKETVTTQSSNVEQPVEETTQVLPPTPVRKASGYQSIVYLVYFLFGALEILLMFRMFLKLTGANISSSFVSMIYSITGLFVLPFEGIFSKAYTKGLETTSVFEPAALVAIIVYVILAFGIVQLIGLLSRREQTE